MWKERGKLEIILTKQKTLFKYTSKALTDTNNLGTLPNHIQSFPVKPEKKKGTLETQVLQITQKSVMVQAQ
jgi:hypothetical protein